MRALQYFFGEAAESLRRGWRPAVFSMLTIAAGLFVLGFFLLVNANLQRLVGGWNDSAELAVYLRDDATTEQAEAVGDVLVEERSRRIHAAAVEGGCAARVLEHLSRPREHSGEPRPESLSGLVRGAAQCPGAAGTGGHRQSGQRRRDDERGR